MTTLGVRQTMRRLFGASAALVVFGVKRLSGLGCSCSVDVGEGSDVVGHGLSEVGACCDVACVGRCISAVLQMSYVLGDGKNLNLFYVKKCEEGAYAWSYRNHIRHWRKLSGK